MWCRAILVGAVIGLLWPPGALKRSLGPDPVIPEVPDEQPLTAKLDLFMPQPLFVDDFSKPPLDAEAIRNGFAPRKLWKISEADPSR
jgi:hypothetical protein